MNVLEIDITTGVLTDFNGKYKITASSADAKLDFLYRGNPPCTTETKGQTQINISHLPDLKPII